MQLEAKIWTSAIKENEILFECYADCLRRLWIPVPTSAKTLTNQIILTQYQDLVWIRYPKETDSNNQTLPYRYLLSLNGVV